MATKLTNPLIAAYRYYRLNRHAPFAKIGTSAHSAID